MLYLFNFSYFCERSVYMDQIIQLVFQSEVCSLWYNVSLLGDFLSRKNAPMMVELSKQVSLISFIDQKGFETSIFEIEKEKYYSWAGIWNRKPFLSRALELNKLFYLSEEMHFLEFQNWLNETSDTLRLVFQSSFFVKCWRKIRLISFYRWFLMKWPCRNNFSIYYRSWTGFTMDYQQPFQKFTWEGGLNKREHQSF